MELDKTIEKINQELIYSEERSILLKHLDSTVLRVLVESEAVVAGGAITSIFSNNPIKDFDIFFKSEAMYHKAVFEFDSLTNIGLCQTRNARTYKNINNTETTIQLICLPTSYKNNPLEIFDEFDFSVCCGAFSFKDNFFYFHKEFFKHLSQRKLVFNKNHKYPISSLLRSKKYEGKGFFISKSEYLKIVFAIAALNIKTNAEAARQLEGMYFGESRSEFELSLHDHTPLNIDKFMKIFDEMKGEPLLPYNKTISIKPKRRTSVSLRYPDKTPSLEDLLDDLPF